MGLFSRKNKKEDKNFSKKDIKSVVNVEEDKKEDKNFSKKDIKSVVNVEEDKKEDKNNNKFYEILIKPIISEKATIGVSKGKYVFEVSNNANKIEIKKAIKDIYGVNVVKINVINKLGKKVSFGRRKGKQKDIRKAIITLKKGETINLYEGI